MYNFTVTGAVCAHFRYPLQIYSDDSNFFRIMCLFVCPAVSQSYSFVQVTWMKTTRISAMPCRRGCGCNTQKLHQIFTLKYERTLGSKPFANGYVPEVAGPETCSPCISRCIYTISFKQHLQVIIYRILLRWHKDHERWTIIAHT